MPVPMTDERLREEGLTALENQLGPVQALRFLALLSREPFDYQRWRQEEFGQMSLTDVLREVGAMDNARTARQ